MSGATAPCPSRQPSNRNQASSRSRRPCCTATVPKCIVRKKMANNLTALEMLRQQAAGRPGAHDPAKRRAQAKPVINKALLSSMHYLAEFAKELNAIQPSTGGPYTFI